MAILTQTSGKAGRTMQEKVLASTLVRVIAGDDGSQVAVLRSQNGETYTLLLSSDEAQRVAAASLVSV